MNKKAIEMNWAMVTMVAMLVLILVVIMLPKGMLMGVGGEAAMSAECSFSLTTHSNSELWVSPKLTLINKNKESVDLKCPTLEKEISTTKDKDASGELIALMEKTNELFSDKATVFHLAKGSVCIVYYKAETLDSLSKVEWIPALLVDKTFGGFEPGHYTSFETKNKIAVIAVYGDSFLPGFTLMKNAGVFLWDSTNYDGLPCAVLEGDPLTVKKGYTT